MTIPLHWLRVQRVFKRSSYAVYGRNCAPFTLKQRSLQGTQTVVGNNSILRPRSGSKTLETTNDVQVWGSWMPVRVRGGAMDGGDTAAGRQWAARGFGMIAAFDVNFIPISLTDDDWLTLPDGALVQIENPTISPDGTYYTFEFVTQR